VARHLVSPAVCSSQCEKRREEALEAGGRPKNTAATTPEPSECHEAGATRESKGISTVHLLCFIFVLCSVSLGVICCV
jgi:hypothetical protein